MRLSAKEAQQITNKARETKADENIARAHRFIDSLIEPKIAEAARAGESKTLVFVPDGYTYEIAEIVGKLLVEEGYDVVVDNESESFVALEISWSDTNECCGKLRYRRPIDMYEDNRG